MKDHSREKYLFESSPVIEAIMRLAFPTVIGQIILVIYNMADTFFIGMTGDSAKLTAVTICMPAFMFLSAISNLFGVGGASAIARALGAKNTKRAADTAAFSLWMCVAVTLAYSALAWFLRDRFVDLLGGSQPEVHLYSVRYLTVTVVIGGFGTALNALLAHLIRAEGRSVQASVGIAMGGILNIALDPLFMFVLLPEGREVLGAAIATAVSNFLSMLYFAVIIALRREKSVLRFKPSARMWTDGLPGDIIKVGLPACLMTLFENISYAILDNLMAGYRVVAMQAGVGVAKKVNMLAHCMVRGMSQGVLPLIGYNYSSGNRRRMRKSVLMAMSISVALACIWMTASLVFSRPLVALFIQDDPETVRYGALFLRILCIGGPFSACAYTVISFFQATGKGKRSFVLAILRKGILDIPLMFLLRKFIPVTGIVMATPIADIVCCAAAIVMFRRFMVTHVHNVPQPADPL